jgi:hypothetical protein
MLGFVRERLPDYCQLKLALPEDVDDILHGGIDLLDAPLYRQGFQQPLGWGVVRQQRAGAKLLSRNHRK